MKITPTPLQDTVTTFFLLNKQLEKKRFSHEEMSDYVPDILHPKEQKEFLIAYSHPSFLENWGISFSEIVQNGERIYDDSFEKKQQLYLQKKFLETYQKTNEPYVFAGFQLLKGGKHHRNEWIFILSNRMPGKNIFPTIFVMKQNFSLHEKKVNRIVAEELFAKKHATRFEQLTKREREVISLVAQGNTSEEIGTQLHIAKNTVSVHRKAVNRKLEIKHISEVVLYARAFELF